MTARLPGGKRLEGGVIRGSPSNVSGKVIQGVLGALTLVLLSSCSDGENAKTAEAIYCYDLCTRAVECGLTRNKPQCRTSCEGDPSGPAVFSVSGAELLGDCVRAQSCSFFFDSPESDQAWSDCWDEARSRVTPSAHVRGFCREYAAALYDCGYAYPPDECEKSYGMWADPIVDRVLSCTAQPSCDGFDACVEGVFDAL